MSNRIFNSGDVLSFSWLPTQYPISSLIIEGQPSVSAADDQPLNFLDGKTLGVFLLTKDSCISGQLGKTVVFTPVPGYLISVSVTMLSLTCDFSITTRFLYAIKLYLHFKCQLIAGYLYIDELRWSISQYQRICSNHGTVFRGSLHWRLYRKQLE